MGHQVPPHRSAHEIRISRVIKSCCQVHCSIEGGLHSLRMIYMSCNRGDVPRLTSCRRSSHGKSQRRKGRPLLSAWGHYSSVRIHVSLLNAFICGLTSDLVPRLSTESLSPGIFASSHLRNGGLLNFQSTFMIVPPLAVLFIMCGAYSSRRMLGQDKARRDRGISGASLTGISPSP